MAYDMYKVPAPLQFTDQELYLIANGWKEIHERDMPKEKTVGSVFAQMMDDKDHNPCKGIILNTQFLEDEKPTYFTCYIYSRVLLYLARGLINYISAVGLDEAQKDIVAFDNRLNDNRLIEEEIL